MTFRTHLATQIVLGTLNLLNALSNYLPMVQTIAPAKYQAVISLTLGVISAVLALINHFVNPDGTPSKVSWSGGLSGPK
jgi:hypothetical protein